MKFFVNSTQSTFSASMKMICETYPRFYYPKGNGFYSAEILRVYNEAQAGVITSERLMELLDVESFRQTMAEVFTFFTCTQKMMKKWVKEELENGEHDWVNEYDLSPKEKISKVIEEDEEFQWWLTVASEKKDAAKRAEFEKKMYSAKANTILTVVFSIDEAKMFPIDKNSVKTFIRSMEELQVRWMDELLPFMERL